MNDRGLSIGQAAGVDEITDFFCAHANADYISHSELQSGRALSPGVWSPDLRKIIRDQINDILEQETANSPAAKIVCAHLHGNLVGIAFVSFGGVLHGKKFGVLDDIIVAPTARGMQVGKQLLDWIVEHITSVGVSRLFLESGLANHNAHKFFEHHGFRQTSIVMMRDLST